MALSIAFTVPVETGMCSPQQVHPWSMMALGMSGWARWLQTHLVPFRALLREHQTGVVVVGYDLEYLQPFTFFDADAFEVTVRARVRDDGSLLCFDFDYTGPAERWARLRLVGRVVRINDGMSLAAQPAALPGSLLDRFGPKERFKDSLPRVLEPSLRDVEWSPEVSSALRVHRGHCEAADQWSFIELPRIIADARETWALEASGDPRASRGLGTPVRRLIAELTRPLFIFDAASVTTQTDGQGHRYLHRIRTSAHVHATVYEALGEASGSLGPGR